MKEPATQAALADLYAIPGHLLWRAAARVNVEIDRILPGTIDIHAYTALLALADHEPQSQRSLSQVIGVSATTLTTVATALQRDALVERVRNPDDRRSYALTRTTAGRAAVRRWAPHVTRVEERLSTQLSEGDAERLREILAHVVAEDLDDRTPQALLRSTGFLVTKAHQRAHREFMAALRPLGIEPRHFGLMRALRTMGPSTQGEVAAMLDVSPAAVVQLVDDLEERGQVERRRDPADRRAYRLHLTAGSRAVLDKASLISAGVLADRLGGPRSRDRKDLVRLLRLLLAP